MTRTSTAAFAVIERRRHDEHQWLAQWNPHWGKLNLVGGHKREDESFRQCVVRETIEELGLALNVDFAVEEAPLSHLEFSAWSESARCETFYVFELFRVALLTERAFEWIDANLDNCWLTKQEICKGRTSSGAPISPTMLRVMEETDWMSIS